MLLKAQTRRLAYRLLLHSGTLDVRRRRRASEGDGWGTVLVFHSTDPTVPEDGLNISPGRFKSILAMLSEKYVVLTVDEVVRRVRERVPFTGREVAITFDDGYLNNYEHAIPALISAGLPATFYLTAGHVGTTKTFAWDREKGTPLHMMSWSHAREMADLGFQIGCHTWSHPDFGTEPISSAETELRVARETLQERTGAAVDHFAYPFGGRDNIRPEWLEAIQEAGFASNCSAFDEPVTSATDAFMIPRLGAAPQRSLEALRIDIDLAW